MSQTSSFNPARRTFVLSTAAGASAAAVAHAAPTFSMDAPALQPVVERDLVFALGTRIGREATDVLVGADPANLVAHFVDSGNSVADALQAGIEQGAAWETGCALSCKEESLAFANSIGTLLVTDLVTGRFVRAEVNATALSHLQMISEGSRSASIQKMAVLNAPAEGLYSLTLG